MTKNQILDIIKTTAILFAICVIITAALGFTNEYTKEPIAEINKQTEQATMQELVKAETYEDINVKFEDIFHTGFEEARSKFMLVSNINLIVFALEIIAFILLISAMFKVIRSHVPDAAAEASFTEERKNIIISENEVKLDKMFKLSNIFMYIALGLNLVINKLAIILGEFSAFVPEGYFDVAGTIYAWTVFISVVLVGWWFVRMRMIISFSKNELYAVTYMWGHEIPKSDSEIPNLD